MDADTASIAKMLVVTVVLIIFIAPFMTSYEPTTVVQFESPASHAQEDSLYHYGLPDINIRIAVGEIAGYRGFAYVIEEESRLYFVDLFNEGTLDIALPAGVKSEGAYLKGYDVDLDGDTEFFLRNFANSTYYILMVDIGDATVSQYPMPFIYASPMGFGMFNGDAYPDLLVQNRNNNHDFLTLDLIANATIGTFNAEYAYVTPVIGRFTSLTQDSIALVNRAGTTSGRNLTVVEADGTQVQNILLAPSIQDMVKFDHLGGLEEIAAIESDGDVVVYSGLTLGVVFTQNVDASSSTSRYIETGDFNGDPQDDLVVISRNQQRAYFRDGNAGSAIREVGGVYSTSVRQLAVGPIDQDALDDLVIGTTYGGLGIIRGVDGDFAHIEYLIDVSASNSHQIISFDYAGNGVDDVVVRLLDGVFVIRSDTTQPILTPLPLDPAHPTILDDYVTIEVHVNETTWIEHVDIWMKLPGSALWMQPQDEMFASHREGIYYAFIGNLQPGEYQYYIDVQDSYLNAGHLGNATNPEVFFVAGDFVWQIDKTETDYVHAMFHQSDIGNLSDGRPVIYTIERANGSLDLTLVKYSRDGGVLNSLAIVNPSGIGFDNFALFTAMLDGDSVLDIIVLDYHWDKAGIMRYHAYHGSTFTLMGNGTVPYPYKSFNYLEVFDDDGDGNEELFIASDTQPYNVIKMDSDLTWTGVDLPYSTDGWYGVRGFSVASDSPSGYIAVVRGDIQIDILTTDLVYSHSLDIDLAGFPNMEYAGIDTIYNATTGEERFVAGFTYWNGSDAKGRLYIFDSSTTNLNDTPVYQLPHPIQFLYPVDARGDGTDELILKLPGELVLTDLGETPTFLWSTPVSGAQPLSALIADFDGDSREEFIMFTDQDEHLTQYSLYNGALEWTIRVGEVYNPLLLGDIDSIPGDEIAAYPIATVTNYSLGAIRSVDTHYIMNATVEFAMTEVIQTEHFDMNVTVLNVYGETISDATVYMDAQYMTPEGPAIHTFGLYYNWFEQHYWGETTASWPMGVANLSLSISHYYYHHYRELFVDMMTVRSPLHLSIEAPPFVNQGDNMTILVKVTDNLDRLVEGANVSVILGGVTQTATPVGLEYMVYYPEVQLGAGNRLAEAQATHPFGTGIEAVFKWINVRILASSLIVYTDFPSIVQQDDLVSAWFNITDQYGSSIPGAIVTLVSGPAGFELIESSIPGCYNFTHFANIGIGNQTFEIRIEKSHIVALMIEEISFDVFGELDPNVFYVQRVEAGSSIEVSVFVKDRYGPVFVGTSVTVDIDGTPYTATHTDGEPEYVLNVLADFLMGPNNFTVYVNATYANPWSGIFHIRAFADAASSAEINSSQGWTIEQGGQTVIELVLRDRLNRTVGGGTVNFFVKALSYGMLEGAHGSYAATLSTSGWAPGEYNYTISVSHEDIETGDPIHGVLTVTGQLVFDVTVIQESPTQGQPLDVVIGIQDIYGNPIPGLDVSVSLMNMPMTTAQETYVVGEYHALFAHLPTTEGYGDFTATITASGEHVATKTEEETITVSPAVPDLAMSTQSISLGAGLSFILSLIGMFVYFRMAASTRVDDKSMEGLKKSVRRMDRLYLLIVVASGIGLAGSYMYYSTAQYGLALVLTVVLLGCSVLLYGLWLYRDAVSAVLIKGALSRRRMALGLWHLVFVPLVIVMMLSYGTEIDWFKHYVIDQSFTIGDFTVPAIMTTIFAAYVSSIIVVVVNLYREASKGIKKIVKMEESGTPTNIVEDEKTSMIGRFSSSIRIKFLMFLVVVGAATVMSMDFLQSYALGVIVLMPVVFLVIIPYISSQIIKGVGRASGAARGKKAVESTTPAEDGMETGELTLKEEMER